MTLAIGSSCTCAACGSVQLPCWALHSFASGAGLSAHLPSLVLGGLQHMRAGANHLMACLKRAFLSKQSDALHAHPCPRDSSGQAAASFAPATAPRQKTWRRPRSGRWSARRSRRRPWRHPRSRLSCPWWPVRQGGGGGGDGMGQNVLTFSPAERGGQVGSQGVDALVRTPFTGRQPGAGCQRRVQQALQKWQL